MRNKSTDDPLALPCWIWSRGRDGQGYGAVWREGRVLSAHRYVYEQLVGPIPDTLFLDHLCREPACVNPDHLEPVTHVENVRRGFVRKLSMPDAEEIRRLHAEGVSLSHLALTYGVTHEAIRLVVRFKTYRPKGMAA